MDDNFEIGEDDIDVAFLNSWLFAEDDKTNSNEANQTRQNSPESTSNPKRRKFSNTVDSIFLIANGIEASQVSEANDLSIINSCFASNNIELPLNEEQRSRHTLWSHIEICFLDAMVLLYFSRYHSMKQKRRMPNSPLDGTTAAWREIHEAYDKVRRRNNEINNTTLPWRSVSAISKKWKSNKEKESRQSTYPTSIQNLMHFMQVLNKDDILTKPTENPANKIGCL